MSGGPYMTLRPAPEEVLRTVRDAAALGQLRYTKHGRERMEERGAQARDVQAALMSAASVEWRPDNETWKVSGGNDLDGEPLLVVGAVVRVVTVF